jgi:dipeptidyl aminopeptidase/acylaminoacyl peptidase
MSSAEKSNISMPNPQIAPYGSWKSPITTDLIVSETIRLGQIALDGQDIYWLEMRPSEGGRAVIVRRTPDGQATDMIPPPFNARTRVHEYGGGSYVVSSSPIYRGSGTIYFSNFDDQHIYQTTANSKPQPITTGENLRYADGIIDRGRQRMICVREDHTVAGREAINTLVSLALDSGDTHILVSGNDFYSSPRLSPDGSRLAWLTWNHPNMPWDGTELWVAELKADGSIDHSQHIVGGTGESIFQPEWSPDGVLHFVSDRTGWWNLYCWHNNRIIPLCEKAVEFGLPQWVFGMSTYAFASPHRIICNYIEQGISHLASLDTTTGRLDPIETPYTAISQVLASANHAIFCGGSPTELTSIVQLDLNTSHIEILRRSSSVAIDPGYLSIPESIEFPTEHGLTAYAFFYPPQNRDYSAPNGERPPLLVMSHGGPTSAANNTLDLDIQFWTSRGIAVLDVNYGGSTGYGRDYRRRLEDQWGIVDVDDCVNGAKYLVNRGIVDGQRLMITGGSAGGYTTLCALTFRDTFKAGASYFGLSDLEADLLETHKFESRYSYKLVAPYPERSDIYHDRSPIHFTDRLSCPVIFFQGLDDKVVLPNQSELMVEALRAKHLPVAYIAFPGEGHGFRRAENIKRSLEAELYFYSRIFGFPLADAIEPVLIENLKA